MTTTAPPRAAIGGDPPTLNTEHDPIVEVLIGLSTLVAVHLTPDPRGPSLTRWIVIATELDGTYRATLATYRTLGHEHTALADVVLEQALTTAARLWGGA